MTIFVEMLQNYTKRLNELLHQQYDGFELVIPNLFDEDYLYMDYSEEIDVVASRSMSVYFTNQVVRIVSFGRNYSQNTGRENTKARVWIAI